MSSGCVLADGGGGSGARGDQGASFDGPSVPAKAADSVVGDGVVVEFGRNGASGDHTEAGSEAVNGATLGGGGGESRADADGVVDDDEVGSAAGGDGSGGGVAGIGSPVDEEIAPGMGGDGLVGGLEPTPVADVFGDIAVIDREGVTVGIDSGGLSGMAKADAVESDVFDDGVFDGQ